MHTYREPDTDYGTTERSSRHSPFAPVTRREQLVPVLKSAWIPLDLLVVVVAVVVVAAAAAAVVVVDVVANPWVVPGRWHFLWRSLWTDVVVVAVREVAWVPD